MVAGFLLVLGLITAQPPMVNLAAEKQSLAEVLSQLASQTGFQFVPVGEARERTVTIVVEKAPLPDVLRRLRTLVGCAFVRSGKVYFAIPLLSSSELLKRLQVQASALPSRWEATVTLRELTGWGWRTTAIHLRFEAPFRFLAESPTFALWSDGKRTWLLDKNHQVVIERLSPLTDWSDATLGVHAVPAFGHGWAQMSDFKPVKVEAAVLLGRPCWVLEWSRKGTPPTQVTFTYIRITLANTVLVPYHEPQPVPWRVRCFVDCETLTVIRREIYDPRGFPLRVITPTEIVLYGGQAIPNRFEVLDGGMSVVGQGEWQWGKPIQEFALPPIPRAALHPETPVGRALAQAEQMWESRDDADGAIHLLKQVLAQTDHPFALVRAATLSARMNRPEEAWACLQKLGERLGQFPEAVALALEVASLLRQWDDLGKRLQTLRDKDLPVIWSALAQLTALRDWQQDRETTEPLLYSLRALHTFATKPSLQPEELSMAWEIARRTFVLAWRHARLTELAQLADKWLTSPLAPLALALQTWVAMESGNEPLVRLKVKELQERFADFLALRLAIAELAEAYGFNDIADAEYQALANSFPLLPEGSKAREHLLRRLVETDQPDEAVRFFLNTLPFYRSDWTKCGFAAEFQATATLSLRHSRIANWAEGWRGRRVPHPYALWLYDLMAHFAESEGNPKEALSLLWQAVSAASPQSFWAARWCQQVLQVHESWMRRDLDEFAAKEQRDWGRQLVVRMDEMVGKWRRAFAQQPFFARLFVFLPSIKAAYEENPSVLRKLAQEQQLRADDWRKTVGTNDPDRLLMDALALLNYVGNWLERPAEIRSALLLAEQLSDAHLARHIARLLFIAFNGVQPDFKQLLPLIDRAVNSCGDEGERIAVAQNALQTLLRNQLWSEALSRYHRWLSLTGSDLFRRSLLLGWRSVLAPLLSDEKIRPFVWQQLAQLPDDAVGWVLRAEALEAMGGADKAREAYEYALTKSNADWLWQLYGEAAQRWGDLERAERALTEAVKQFPTWERALLLLQVREALNRPLEPQTLLRWMGYFGWQWQLLTALAAQSEPQEAFRLFRLAERLATFDPTIERLPLFQLRLALAKSALAVGQTQLARYWLELLRQPESPDPIRRQALDLLPQGGG